MNTKTIIIIAIALLVVVGVIIFVSNKNKAAVATAGSSQATGQSISNVTGAGPVADCVPYTDAQYKRALANCRTKCYPKWLIPVVGVGAYTKCMNECKQGLPYINNCI